MIIENIKTNNGYWLYSSDIKFCFAYIDDKYSENQVKIIKEAFGKMPDYFEMINEKIPDTNTKGSNTIRDFYLLDDKAISKIMSSIKGMGQVSIQNVKFSGESTAQNICKTFFANVLEKLGGDISSISSILLNGMNSIQNQVKETTVKNAFGILIGIVSLMPGMDIVVISFYYIYVSVDYKKWFISLNCSSPNTVKYSLSYKIIAYNYNIT
jgi:hypothetical protein